MISGDIWYWLATGTCGTVEVVNPTGYGTGHGGRDDGRSDDDDGDVAVLALQHLLRQALGEAVHVGRVTHQPDACHQFHQLNSYF